MPRNLMHTRTIAVEVYDEGDGTLSIEGRLQDTQPPESGYHKVGRRENDPRPPLVQHGMSARFRVDRQTSRIIKTDGEFPHTPHEKCDAVVGWLGRLDGLSIASGYTAKSREQLGGPRGCAHMSTLLQVMANTKAAASAYFMPGTREERVRIFKQQIAATGKTTLTDTCHVWKAGGERDMEIRAEVAAAEAQGTI